MKIFVIAAIHGDELFGLKIIGRIKKYFKNEILIRVGHPEAIAKRKKFIEEDLNRSFNSKKQSVESQIAKDIKKEITNSVADLIIDIHTSIVSVGKVAIVAKHNPLTEYVAQALSMDVLVIMPKSLTKTALIGCFPNKSISIEFGRDNKSDTLASEIAKKIESLNFSKSKKNSNNLPIFQVYDQIDKNYKGLSTIKNLVFNKELGGYPFLAGLNTYKSIGGFLAKKIN